MTSIIFGHYSETEERDALAFKCLEAAHAQTNEDTELIIVFNGRYKYKDKFCALADRWHERDADKMPGRTINTGIRIARGDIYFIMANDVLLKDGAVEECVRLIRAYPQFIISPEHPPRYKNRLNIPFDKYITNNRSGDSVNCMTQQQIDDIGARDEVALLTDEINYINRRIAKGYTVLLTEKPMATNMAPGVHSFKSQMKGWKGYKGSKPIYSTEELIKKSYV